MGTLKKLNTSKKTAEEEKISVGKGALKKIGGASEQKTAENTAKAGTGASLPSAASGKAETAATTKKDEETPRWKQLLASTNEKGKAVESGQAKAETKPFETRTRELTRARAGDADALATREMKLGNTERVEKDNPYANALAAAWHSVESGYANALSMAQQGAAKIEEAYAPYAGTSHAREEMGYQTTKEDAAKKNRAAYELTQGRADRLSEQAAKETEAAKAGQGTIGKLLIDLGVQGVQMGTDIAAGAATGGGALVPMAVRVFGQGAQEARQAGASYGQQLAYGAALAAVETATEKMFDGVAGAYGKGWFGEMKSAKQLAAALDKKLASRPAGRAALKLLGSMAGEGAEELVSGIVNPIAKMIYNGQGIQESYRENFDWSETLYEGLVGALMGGLGGAVELPGNYQDGKMRAVTAAIDSYYDSIEKNGLFSREAQGRAAEAERAIRRLTKTKGQVTQTMQGGGEKEEKARRAEAATAERTAEIAKNGAESAQEPARAAGEETTRRELTEAQRDALEEERSRFYTYLLSGGGTEAAVNENLGKMKGDALRRAEQYLVEALNNGDIIEENGVYRRSDARAEAEQRFEREKELRQSGIHGDTGWMSRKDAAHLEQLARTGGVSVEIVDTLGDAQGTYDPRTGRIQIARDATDPVGFVIQHELTHRMKQNSPEKWSEFLGYVQKHYGESWERTVEDYRRRYAEHHIDLTAEEAAEEAAADFAGRMDQEEIRRLTQENRSLAQKILDAIRSLIRRLKGGENQRLYEMEKLWADALKEGKENTAGKRNAESTRSWEALQSRETGATINEKTTKTEEGISNDESRTRGTENAAQESEQNERGGEPVRRTAAKTVRGGVVLGGQRELTPSFGEKPRRTWAEGHTVEPVRGSAAYAEQQTAMEYGIPSFVIVDDVWDANKGKAPAFSTNGQIYFKESVPQKNAGMLAYHELTHVMKQVGYEPYLKFTKGVAERLNMNSKAAHLLLEHEARHRKIDIFGEDGKLDLRKLHKLNDAERLKLYDELNATLYGHIGSGKLDGLSEYLETAFYDFSSYAAELAEIHEGFKQRNGALKEGKENTANEGGVKHSINKRFSRELAEWERDGKPAGERFVLGSTGSVLQGLGAIESDIYINGDKINTILEQHSEMSIQEIQRIPEVLEDPVLILKSRGTGQRRGNSRVVLYGTLKARNGQPVLAVLDFRPSENGLVLNDMQKVNSAYTKENPARFITNSEILYADKKRTAPLLRRFGLTIASRELLQDGSIGSISYEGDNVKMHGVPLSSVVDVSLDASAERGLPPANTKNDARSSREKKFSLKSYTEEEKQQHIKDAAAYFGKTDEWSETGYITTDGGRLDFSGRHEGGSGGDRTVDHRDIRDALGDDYGGDDYSGSMVQFMSEGNIRISPESGGIDLSVKPTRAQEAALSDFISKQRGEVILDLDTAEGKTVSSTEYPRGTSASKVLADIRVYFEDGTEPQVSEVARYRYSLKDSAGRELTEAQREYFKDSKVRDKSGQLLPVYHTTYDEFTTFDRNKLGEITDGNATDETMAATAHIGFWFNTQDLRKNYGKSSRVEEVYLNITNPLKMGSLDELYNYVSLYGGDGSAAEMGEAVADALRDNGYDGIVLRDEEFGGTSYVALEPEQIKRVTNENPTEDPDIRRSLQGSMNAAEEAERLRAQNERLTQELDALSKELRRVDDRLRTETLNSTDRVETGRAAAELLKRFGSKADWTEITNSLLKLYDGMALGEMSRKEMKEQARAIADEVIDHVEENVNPLYEEYEALRKGLRTDKVTLPAEYRADIQDGYNEARKRAFGKVKIGNNGTPVDVQYEMLNDRYPELFPSDILTPPDQLTRMLEVAESLQKEMGSPYQGMEGEDVRQSLANDILEQFFDISTTQGAKLMRMQREWEKQREKDRRATDERFHKSRERQKERLEKLEKSFQERDRKRRERATASERRKQIAAGVEKMTRQLIRPTDKKHIPAEMQDTVMAFVSMVNTESGFEWKMNPDGTYSKKHVKTGEGAPTARTVRARELKDALEQLQKSKTKNGEAAAEHTIDPNLRGNIDRIIDMGEKKLTEMTREELDTVWETYCAINAMVKNSDRMLGGSKYERVSEAAEALRAENGWRRDRRALRGRLKTLDELVNLDTMTAETFFHKLGKAGDELFRAMRNAADQQTRIVKEGTDLAARAVKDSGLEVKELEKKKETFRLESGEALTLTKAQLMELYELTKREQAQGHIFGVGIVPDKVDSGLLTEERSEAVRVTMNDVGKMLETLTPEEKKLADALQRYMSGALAMHGNEASRAVYGYDKFTEQHYWPIKVNRGETKTNPPKEAESKIIPTYGMTNATIQDAKNGIVLRSFMDSFTEHLNQMATYSAWLATSEDLDRIHNFAFLDEDGEQTGKTTKTLIKKVFGDGGDKYWNKLMQDIALGTKAGAESNPMNKFFSNYKAAAVGFNARVVLQQPTAILRAMAVIRPKYLAEGMARKGGWKKALEHSPLAQWKDWGYFELDNGKSLRELIVGSESMAEKIRSKSMAGAGWGDSIAWGALWNAIEAETEATKRSVAPGSEEFYRIVNDRFEDVIYRTQVVDSVLNRSQAMRKSGWNLFTSFMGEPMKTANMVQRSIYDMTRATESGNTEAKKAAGRSIGRTALSVAASWAVNALMQSIADMFRDDDRDEKTLEKQPGKWVENFASNLNPAQYIPFARDFQSIMEGYDVERLDMAAFADAWKALEAALKAWGGDGKKTKGFASLDLVMQLCKAAGLPAANLERDIEDLIGGTLLQAGQWQALYAFDKMKFSTENNKTHYYESLYYAMLDDWEEYEEVYRRMLEDGFEEKEIGKGIENCVKKALGVEHVDELPARWGAPGTAQGQAWKRYVEQSSEVLGKTKDQIEKEEKQREKEKKKEEKEKEEK